MATVLDPPKTEQTVSDGVLLQNISWATYEGLLNDYVDVRNPRFTYDRGDLLIMVLSAEHEEINETITLLINLFAEEFGIQSRGFGSTTYKRKDLSRGFEPDSCFYFQNEAKMRGKRRIDLAIDPPPDLVIEIDISHPTIKKLPIFASFGIPEVWRFDGKTLEIFRLEGGEYVTSHNSLVLALVSAETITRFVDESANSGRLEWIKKVRDWAREFKKA
jgi:Uma2 family endonuclease